MDPLRFVEAHGAPRARSERRPNRLEFGPAETGFGLLLRVSRLVARESDRFAGTFAGATGLEPATSGVTGRSWHFRVGFANSGGLVFVDESAEQIAAAESAGTISGVGSRPSGGRRRSARCGLVLVVVAAVRVRGGGGRGSGFGRGSRRGRYVPSVRRRRLRSVPVLAPGSPSFLRSGTLRRRRD